MNDEYPRSDSHENDRDQIEQRLIESLLKSAIGNASEEAQAKVTRALGQLDNNRSGKTGELAEILPAKVNRFWYSRRTLIGIVTAAAVMIAVALPFIFDGQSAMATLRLSLAESKRDVARHYSLESTFQRKNDQTYTRGSDLYVKGNNRFAIRKAGLLGRQWWLGGEGDHTWVLPAVGPIIEGDTPGLTRWLKRKPELSTPYLHVSSILERMGKGYKLTVHRESTITGPGGEEIRCRQIEGRLRRVVDARDFEDRIPDRIELWADLDSGVAHKVIASWDIAAGEAGRLSITAQLLDQPDLPDNWFQPEGHYEGQRRRITFNSREF